MEIPSMQCEPTQEMALTGNSSAFPSSNSHTVGARSSRAIIPRTAVGAQVGKTILRSGC